MLKTKKIAFIQVSPPMRKDTASNKTSYLQSMPAMMHSINQAGEIIDVSNIWLEKMGYERGDVLGRKSVDFLSMDSREMAINRWLPEFFNTGFCRDIPYTFVKKNGEILEVLLSAGSERNEEGAFLHSCAVLIDVTERNRLGNELCASELRYRSMIKGMLNGFALHEVICDEMGQPVDYRYLETNSAFDRIMGRTADQIIGRTVLEVLPKTETYWIETFGQVALSRQSIHFENFNAELQRHFDVLAFSPAERQFAIVITDITERKHNEIKINQSEELFRRTFDQSPIGAAMVGLDYRFLKVNQELCRITGYQAEELLNLRFPDITCADDLHLDLKQAEELAQGLIEQYEMDKRYIRKDGKPVWVRLSARLIRDNQGTPLYFLPMMVEIDDHKRLEEEKEIQLELFRMIIENSDLKTMAKRILTFLKNWSGVDAIAIRLQRGNDFPYYATVGFPKEFIQRENSLKSWDFKKRQSAKKREQASLECMCGFVINKRCDTSLPFFTDGGSFCTNSTSLLLSQSDTIKMPPGVRNHCHEAGYESVLLVPLRVGENTLGLIQLNHKEKNRFTAEFVTLMEQLAGHISVAVIHRLAEENLKIKQAELEEVNAALNVLIRKREEDLLEHDRGILMNIHQLILPCVDRLKLGSLDISQKSQLDILQSNLKTISSPFAKKLYSVNSTLTPSLIQVADMIKKGLSNKEIASLLGISVKSVETYRKRIRERLHLKNSKINLRAYLINMD